jgi:hypothetical protein
MHQPQANDAALEKTLVFEYARVTRTSKITINNDAKLCYDRRIRVFSITACMSVGLPTPARVSRHRLLGSQYDNKVRTLHGISAELYSAIDKVPLEGSGQGSGG